MSSKKKTQAKSVALKAKKKSKPADDGVKTHNAAVAAEHWSVTTVDDVAASRVKEGGRYRIKLIRRTKNSNGEYKPLKQERSTLSIITSTFLLSSKSYLSGEGNVGVGDKFPPSRGKARFTATLMKGNLRDGVDRPDLLQDQEACLKRNEELARKLMADVYDLKDAEWDGPINKAKADARSELYARVTNPETGEPCQSARDLMSVEREDPDVKEMVNTAARKKFVDNAYLLPGVGRPDEDGNEREPILRLQRNVWPFKKFDASKDSQSQETGPSLDELPSTLENWWQIEAAMTDSRGKMRRKWKPLEYADCTGAHIKRPKVTVYGEKIVDGEKRVKVSKQIGDPWFNPALQGRKGTPYESLVAADVIWSLFRGPPDQKDKYGIHLVIGGPITIVNRKPRPERSVKVDAPYAALFEEEESSEDEKAAAAKNAKQEENADDQQPMETDGEAAKAEGSAPKDEGTESGDAEASSGVAATSGKKTKKRARETASDSELSSLSRHAAAASTDSGASSLSYEEVVQPPSKKRSRKKKPAVEEHDIFF